MTGPSADRPPIHSEIRMVNGDAVRVEGDLGDVEKVLSDAARSGSARFAWLAAGATGRRIGINPDQVVSLGAVDEER